MPRIMTIRAATAYSEDVEDGFLAGQQIAEQTRAVVAPGKHSVGVLFASIRFDLDALVRGVRSRLDVPLVGCTTHSEASDEGYFEDAAVLLLMTSDEPAFGVGLGERIGEGVDAAVATAHDAASRALGGPAKLAIVLPDAALSFTGESVLANVARLVGPNVPVVGGLPGDGGRLKQTFQVFGDRVVSGAIAILLVGGDVEPVVVTRSGWVPIGQTAVATKTKGPVLEEINGRPAIEYLKRYVSDVDDPSTLAMYPLALLEGTLGLANASKYFVIRSPFSYDKASGAVTYGGTIPEGASVQLVKGTRDDIIAGAHDAAETLVARLAGRSPSCMLFFSCAGRKLMLGLDTKREIATMLSGLGESVPVAGFYSYGEIGPLDSTDEALRAPRFHNTTLVLCALTTSASAHSHGREERAHPRKGEARKIEQLERQLEQIDKVARENERVSSRLYRELDELSRQLASEKDKVSSLLRILEKYVPQGARDELEQYRGGPIAMGGKRVRRAILFSDLRGFTSMSERLAPDVVVALLNGYLKAMTAVILAHGGDINEYIGDAILAVFRDSHAAVTAATAMQVALGKLREETDDENMRALRMGIGIHIGDVVEGNIGTPERVKFGVVGDTVNLAARIQDRSRDGKHTCVLVSPSVRDDVHAGFDLEVVGDLAFKGKTEPVRVYEVVRAVTGADPARERG
jgi:class 3 adenylate cyclase